MSASRAAAASCSESSPSSPASSPATRDSRAVKSCCARSARARAWVRASVSRPTSCSAAAARLRSPLTCPWSRATPSRRSAAARCRLVTRRSSSAKACSAVCRSARADSSAVRLPATSARICSSCSRIRPASASSSAGSRPSGTSGCEAALRTRSAARFAVPRRRSRSPERPNQVSCASARAGRSSRRASSRAASVSRVAVSAVSSSVRRSTRTDSSASSCSRAARAVARSSAISRARASRTSAWTTAAWRATSAWRPSGLSWRRISVSRSASRVRLPSVDSSLRSAFSLRLRCFRTPAASSMKPRRSSGFACRIESSCPCPTITCISRPMPESLEQLLDVEQPAVVCR